MLCISSDLCEVPDSERRTPDALHVVQARASQMSTARIRGRLSESLSISGGDQPVKYYSNTPRIATVRTVCCRSVMVEVPSLFSDSVPWFATSPASYRGLLVSLLPLHTVPDANNRSASLSTLFPITRPDSEALPSRLPRSFP